MEKEDYKYLSLIFFFTLVVFFPVFSVYFTGDDFFHFKISLTDGSLLSFLKLFGIYQISVRGYAFYRPIFREGLYHLYYSLFGLNHIPFRVLQFLVLFTNTSLMYVLLKKIFKPRYIAVLATFFFALGAANVGSLYYMAGGIQAQGALMFLLLCLLFFWKRKFVVSFIFFLLSLGSHELSIMIPALLVGLVWLEAKSFKDFLIKVIKKVLPFGLVSIAFVYVTVFVIGLSSKEVQYQPTFSPKAFVNTLAWYAGWAIGLPEMLIDYVKSGLSLNPNLMKFWGSYFKVIFPTFFVSLGLLALISFSLLIRKLKVFKERRFWFFVFWFPVALMPVLFFPQHKSTYYLTTALPAFWTVVGYLVWRYYETAHSKKIAKIVIGLFVIVLWIFNLFSIRVGDQTYWAAQRGRVAQKLITQIKEKYPTLPQGALVLWVNDPAYPVLQGDWKGSSNQAYFVLNGNDALTLLYRDPTLKVFYEDRGGVPEELKDNHIYQITAKIN